MKKKYIWTIMLAAFIVTGLCACGKKTSEGGQAGSPAAGGSGTAAQGSASQGSSQNASQDTSQNDNSGSAGSTSAGSADASAVSGGSQADAGDGQSADAGATYDELNQSGENGSDGTTSSPWDGTFAGSDGDMLSISTVDEHTLSFSFSASGIGGSADVEGNQAVYIGDDGNQVVFDLSGNSITVSVLNEEGQPEEAAFGGTYTLQ